MDEGINCLSMAYENEAHWVLQLKRIGNMERVVSCFMGSFLLWAILVLDAVLMVSGNAEGGW